MILKTVLATAILILVGSLHGQAALAYTTVGSTYIQKFDGLGSSTSASTWTDDSTSNPLGLGWYARTDVTPTIPSYTANTGGNNTGGLYSFGSTSAADRALGIADSNAFTGTSGSGQSYIGLRINNQTGGSLDQFILAYTGEQWRRENNANNQILTVSYKIGATGVNDSSGWIIISSLQFDSPVESTGTGVALDGNLAANRVVLSPATVGLSWANGQDLWIRWVGVNDSGNDHQLAIDDVEFSASGTLAAVPEPSTFIAGVGLALGMLGTFVRKLRRQ